MQSLVIGGVIGGAAGIMAVLRSSAANSDSFGTEITFFAYTILILGGAATKWGPSSGRPSSGSWSAGLDAFLREAQDRDLLPRFLAGSDAVGAVTLFAVGLGLTLLG